MGPAGRPSVVSRAGPTGRRLSCLSTEAGVKARYAPTRHGMLNILVRHRKPLTLEAGSP